MDQTTPNYGIFSHDGSYPSGYPEYFPAYVDPEYDTPRQFLPADPIYQQIMDPCALPDSPPDSNIGMIPMSYPHGINQYSGSYPMQMNMASNQSGAIPVPGKKPAAIRHPSFPYANPTKRLRGNSANSSSTNSPLSIGSFKHEDEIELPYIYNPQPGQYYNPSESYSGSTEENHRNIEFTPVFKEQWNRIVGDGGKKLSITDFKVQADKGFNFSQSDEAFICQKKNHFQVTVQIGVTDQPKYLHVPNASGELAYYPIKSFYIDLFGAKTEALDQAIKIEQSQSDRSRKPFVPHVMTFPQLQQQFTLGRLHFSETTANNMRKKGKPNPDQRFFRLAVALYAETSSQSGEHSKRYLVYSVASENIIVRASNPGQFENDAAPAPAWQKAPHEDDAIFHVGNIGVNNEHPEEALDVRGNMRLTGRMIQPSDGRAKEILEECDSRRQLENIRKLRIYRYKYRDDAAKALGITGSAIYDTGIIAQEVLDTIPEAVEMVGDVVLKDGETIENFLMVNKDRLFMENLGAVKELTLITDNYANRITKLERLKTYLKSSGQLRDSFRSYISSTTARTASSAYGTSVSARPSIYGIADSQKPSSAAKPPITPKSVFGKNYVQWLTLGLVVLIAVVLIAMLSMYFVTHNSKSDHRDDEKFPTTSSFLSASVTGFHTSYPPGDTGNTEPSVVVPSLQTTQISDENITSSIAPGVTVNPTVVNSNSSFWDTLFETGHCTYIMPISVDRQCVLNSTYAAIPGKCDVWNSGHYHGADKPVNLECCAALQREDTYPQELIHFPEYRPAYNAGLPKNLPISFSLGEVDGSTHKFNRGKSAVSLENQLVRTELDNGMAVKFEQARRIPDCPPHPVDVEGFSWGLLDKIVLEEPNITLKSQYCYSIKQPCGFNRTFTITLPLSRYYTVPNITVAFTPQLDTEMVTCNYVVHGQGCYTKLAPAVIQRGRLGRINLPVGSSAQSELQVRVASSELVQRYGNRICDMDSADIYKYNLVFSRSCI